MLWVCDPPGACGSSAGSLLRPRADQGSNGEEGRAMPTKSSVAATKSRNAIAVLAWLSFVGTASPALAQNPLPIPSNLGPVYSLPSGPLARITVHRRSRLYRRWIRWYVVPYRPLFRTSAGAFPRVLNRPTRKEDSVSLDGDCINQSASQRRSKQ
jgi:hypothetical protein